MELHVFYRMDDIAYPVIAKLFVSTFFYLQWHGRGNFTGPRQFIWSVFPSLFFFVAGFSVGGLLLYPTISGTWAMNAQTTMAGGHVLGVASKQEVQVGRGQGAGSCML